VAYRGDSVCCRYIWCHSGDDSKAKILKVFHLEKLVPLNVGKESDLGRRIDIKSIKVGVEWIGGNAGKFEVWGQ